MSYIGPISVAAGSRIISPGAGGGGNPAGPNCVLLLHCDGISGSTSFPDSSGLGHVATPVGLAQVTATQLKFGTGSLRLAASPDSLALDGSTDFAFGTGDFTVDLWCYKPSSSSGSGGYLFDCGSTGPALLLWTAANFYVDTLGVDRIGAVPTTMDAWHHVAMTRSSGTITLWVDGVASGTYAAGAESYGVAASSPKIGNSVVGYQEATGFVDEVRVLKGRAAYTSNFTPPTTPYT